MSLQALINEALLKAQEERKNRERSGKFSPSQLGRCFRCQICNRANIPQSNPPDERSLRIFKCGHLFHDFVQSFIPDNQTEVLCENDDFKGFADVINGEVVYDIKSVHSGSFWYAQKEGYDVKKEKYHNWLQLAYYAWILKKPRIALVQISKDDLCINEYGDFTERWLDKLQAEIDELRWHWGNYSTQQALPSASPRFNREGKYCAYRDYCKGVESEYKRDISEHTCFAEPKGRGSRKHKAGVAKG